MIGLDYSDTIDMRYITYNYYKRSLLRKMVRDFVPNNVLCARVLDIGCGTGVYLDAFDDGVGIDLNLNEKQLKEDRFIQSDITQKLPFRENEFDIALLLDVLEHLEKPEEVLKEVHRVTRYGFIAEIPTSDVIPWYYDPWNWWRQKKNLALLP